MTSLTQEINIIQNGHDEISKCNWLYLNIILKHGLQMENYMLDTSLKLIQIMKDSNLMEFHLDENRVLYTTGSVAEGLFLPFVRGTSYLLTEADYDEMDVLKVFKIFNSNELYHHLPSEYCLHVKPSKFQGYCNIYRCLNDKIVQSKTLRTNNFELSKEGYPYPKHISGVYQKELQSDTDSVAITFKQEMKSILGSRFMLSADLVTSLECTFWPNDAKEWILRTRHCNWPTKTMIDQIKESGCHIVPKTHPLSKDKAEWRYSFSITAELPLALSLNKLQRFSYLVLKMFFRNFKNKYTDFVFTSYHLKTTMFWYCEETAEIQWNDDNIAVNTMRMLDKLLSFVNSKNLPNYFFRNNNMISHFDIESTAYRSSLKLLNLCRDDPISAILYSSNLTYYYKELFMALCKPVLDNLYAKTGNVVHVLATLMNIVNHHFKRKEFKLSIPACKDVLKYLTKEIESYNDLDSYFFSVALECCYNAVGNFEDAMLQNVANLKIMENNPESDLYLIGSWLITKSQYHFSKLICQKIKDNKKWKSVNEMFSIAEHFSTYDLNAMTHCLWAITFSNFCIYEQKYNKAETLLLKCLMILKDRTEDYFKHCKTFVNTEKEDGEIEYRIGPCEFETFDTYIQDIFEVKHISAIRARYSYDTYSYDQIKCPQIYIVYYLLILVYSSKQDTNSAIELLDDFEKSINKNIILTNLRADPYFDSFLLLAHSYLRMGILNKVDFWFSKCYLGRNINPEMNQYQEQVILFYKLCQIYDNCFL